MGESKLKIPEKCPACHIKMETPNAYWIQRTEPDYDSEVEDHIEDQIWECSKCHALFRLLRWKLESFTQLVEK